MPESMSIERLQLLKTRGAKIVLTPSHLGMQGAVKEALKIQSEIPGSIIMGQFSNPANPLAHIEDTSQEIWEDLDGMIDYFVAGVGTGGTISGIAKGLKKHSNKIKAIAVEPFESPMITKHIAGSHKIQGIGANFVPDNYASEIVDEVLSIKSNTAIGYTQLLNETESILAGISAGANIATAVEIARRPENEGKNIVTVLPDTGEHYISLDIFNPEKRIDIQ